MIIFLRNIRQQLQSENKISKYLIYAIGEIALVLVRIPACLPGRLIALQIYNWNEWSNEKTKHILLTQVFLIISIFSVGAQIDKNSNLFIELKKQDSIFFERGFNQCDFEYLEKHIADDLKFYHDQSGFQNRRDFFENTKKYICGNPDKKPIRKLEQGSLDAFPLYNDGTLYGVIQHGIHHFYIRERGKPDLWTSTAKFTTVWIKENDIWQMSDVLSYDHHAPAPKN